MTSSNSVDDEIFVNDTNHSNFEYPFHTSFMSIAFAPICTHFSLFHHMIIYFPYRDLLLYFSAWYMDS